MDKECIKSYHDFLEELSSMDKYIVFEAYDKFTPIYTKYTNLPHDDILYRIKDFGYGLDNNNSYNLFSKAKNKLFTMKSNLNTKLYDEISMKDLLSNQSIKVKNIIWDKLFLIYKNYLECFDEDKTDRIEQMNVSLGIFVEDKEDKEKEKISPEERKEILDHITEIFGKSNVNGRLIDIVDDIINKFYGLDIQDEKISKKIKPFVNTLTNKYRKDILNGKIDLQKLIIVILEKLPTLTKYAQGSKSNNDSNENNDEILPEDIEKLINDANISTDLKIPDEIKKKLENKKKKDFDLSNMNPELLMNIVNELKTRTPSMSNETG
jgi:hypothetical protein